MKKDLIKVYFRLNSPYEWGKGMSSELFETFNKEALNIIKNIGFNISNDGSSSFSCPEGIKGEENLYMHPMDFSGILSEESFMKAKQVIEMAQLESSIFSIRTIDVYELEERHQKYIESNLEKQKKLDNQ